MGHGQQLTEYGSCSGHTRCGAVHRENVATDMEGYGGIVGLDIPNEVVTRPQERDKIDTIKMDHIPSTVRRTGHT
ncbi:hypothetical protein GCM10022198_04800 [Klugiella xanthotipulae]